MPPRRGWRCCGEAPLPAEAFAKEARLRAAAEDYLKAAVRMERFGA